jgi:hypothetical protein
VKFVKHIAAIIFGMIFLISSSGFMIYKSHCTCTGKNYVSVFVTPKTCYSEAHHHKNDVNTTSCSTEHCEDCINHTEDCGCAAPKGVFLKLVNQVIDEEVKFIEIQPIEIFTAFCNVNIHILDESEIEEDHNFYVDPPPILTTSHDFLIQIQKLKIPLVA